MLLLLLLTGCTSVRPIVKIGLIAPFEGLYRDSGYAALDGVRAAIAACTPPGLDVLPVALDDGGLPDQAQRSAQKLLADPAVVAVIGPLLYPLLPSVEAVVRPTGLAWITPLTVLPSGDFAPPEAETWPAAQVAFIRQATQPPRLLVVAMPPSLATGWQPPPNVLRLDAPQSALTAAAAGDSVLWLGEPAAAAPWLAEAQAAHGTIPLWLSAQAGGDILPHHLAASSVFHWVVWQDTGYTDGSKPQPSIPMSSPIRQVAYQAACQALAGLADAAPSTRP
jgi:branched-chain amino acid transport system substrate-binding protein